MALKDDRQEYREIDSADSGGGYDWDVFAVLRGADGLLYVASDAGCSCNYFGDWGIDAEPVANWHEAVKRVREWMGDYRASEGEALIERLTKSRPKKRDAKQFAALDAERW